MQQADEAPLSPVDRMLRPFSEVRAGEGGRALLLLGNLLLLLTAYYVIKTVREPLILAGGGAELKTYAAAAQAVVLLGFVPAYSWLVARTERLKLLVGVTLFFVANIQLFYAGAYLGVPYLGFLFYVWVGIFSTATVAQFWSFANDIYSREEGDRLFPIIAIGATLGGVVGSRLASALFAVGVGAYEILQVASALLVVHTGLYVVVGRGLPRGAQPREERPSTSNGFALVARSPYLRLIAALLILLNLVNTTGEYILSRSVARAAEIATGATSGEAFEAFAGEFYGDYFFWVSLGTVVLQSFVVSRIVKYLGMAGALFALPVVALGAYGLVASGVGLAALRWAKSAENMTDYSVMNTAKAMLWLPTTREEKYAGKQAIDTFFVRVGDMLAGAVVFVGTSVLALSVEGFALMNLALIGAWLGVGWWLYRGYRRQVATS